jgi:hypothetical protein
MRTHTVGLRLATCLAFSTVTAAAGPLHAQGRLVGYRSASLGVVYENWSFSNGVPQPTPSGDNTVLVDHASEVSFPLSLSVPIGEKWTVGLSTAYSSGRVVLSGTDPELNTSHYTLSGLTDARIRATGRISPTVSVTLGLNAPTGQTSLDPEELSAFRVLAAPALSFQVARLGSGVSGTAGVVLSRQLGAVWAGALGVSYEVRGKYDPGALIPALSNTDYSPGDALRISLGLDGPVGQNGMTLGLSADFYPNHDEISDPGLANGEALTTQLGPVLTADWQLRVGAARFRELTLYAIDRYRTKYGSGSSSTGTVAVSNSSGNYLDVGVRSILATGSRNGILAAVNFRHQTGLKADETIATAAMVSGAATLGLVRELGRGYVVQPFVRGQIGRIKTGEQSSTATGIAGGVTLGLRF